TSRGYRWLYLMTLRGQSVLFTADSVKEDEYGHVDPGVAYEDHPAELRDVFSSGNAQVVGPYTDEWGTFVSAFIPITDLTSGQVLGVLGVDIDYSIWRGGIWRDIGSTVSMLTSIVVLYTLLVFIVRRRNAILNATRTSERKLAAAIAAVRDAFIVMDDRRTVTVWNKAAEQLFGYSAAEAIGKEVHVLVAPLVDAQKYTQDMEHFFQTGSTWVVGKTHELQMKRKDGSTFTASLSVSSMNLEGRWYAIGTVRDITEQKRAEEALRRLAHIVDSSDDAIIGKTLDGTIISWNHGAQVQYGYANDEVLGKSISLLFPSERYNDFKVILGRIRKGKPVHHYETVRKRKDGSIIDISLSVSPIKDGAAKIIGAASIARDITDKKRAEVRLQQYASELEKFKLAVDNASDHIVITDQDGVVLYMNDAAERITGFPRAEVIGKKAGSGQLWGGLMDKRYYEKLWRTIKTEKKPLFSEIHNKRKGGVPYEAAVSISPIVDGAGIVKFFIGVERDITREKEVDRAKTEFVSLASHQLRTPLSAINWYTEMLLAGDAGKITKEQRQYLDEVYRGNKRMVELVNALLNVSRLELGTFIVEPEMTDMKALVRGVIGELKPHITAKKLRIQQSFAKEVPRMNVDPKLMRTVFQNLLSNAVKYTLKSGTVRVALAMAKAGNDFGGRNVRADSLCITVADTGMGIPAHQQNQIFQKLFRADNVRVTDSEGTGLGLYIVKAILDQSGGMVWFHSTEGKGTTFYATIPKAGMRKKEGTKLLS
ncbi:MAG: PAS domain S-box protein, partial [Patescibacteria group bacterium]|nr:PAS domain S-box protein [Patescibacteria group bacterium]